MARFVLGWRAMPARGRARATTLLLVLAMSGAGVLAAAAQSGRTARGEAPPEEPQTCAGECHQEVRDHKVMHGPAATDCQACHVVKNAEAHTFSLITRRKEDLCVRCHVLPHRDRLHEPVREGMCLRCHDPHGSDRKVMLVADPQGPLCTQCHGSAFGEAKFVHGPVAVGACIVCHEPHSSERPSLLSDEPKRLCLTCHSEVESAASEARHLHGALEQGCTPCHDPHASDHEFQLVDTSPGLCAGCHEPHVASMQAAPVVHGAVMEEGGCTTCHLPHGSRLPALQRLEQPDACLVCHDEQIQTAGGEVLTNMAALLESNPDHHGPIREGACTTCHEPHAGEHFRLLVQDYPPEFYAPFSIDRFGLCFQCHIPDLVLQESGRGLTSFRDGDRNLHWLHVNQEKGRTCRACHEVHASKRPAHVREAVPFGDSGWMLEINFTKNENGGSCTPACHKKRTYTHDGKSRAPAASGQKARMQADRETLP